MRVTCPACSAAYEVPDAKIGAGRRLRCARCQHGWWVAPPEPPVPAEPPAPAAAAEGPFARAVTQVMPAAAPSAGPEPAPPPLPEPPPPPPPVIPPPMPPSPAAQRSPPAMAVPAGPIAPPRPPSEAPGGGTPLMLAWVASILVFLAFGAALLLYPAQIIEAWPPAERLYIALGIVPGR